MNRHSNHHCSSVAETINRQVGPRSPLFCSSPRTVADSRTVLACDPAQRAINRQVGPKSPLYAAPATWSLSLPSNAVLQMKPSTASSAPALHCIADKTL